VKQLAGDGENDRIGPGIQQGRQIEHRKRRPLGPQSDRPVGAFHHDRPPPASIGALVGQHRVRAFALLAAGDGRLERIALLGQDVALGGQRIDLLVDFHGPVGQSRDLLLDQHFSPPPACRFRDHIQPGLLQQFGPVVRLPGRLDLLGCRRRQLGQGLLGGILRRRGWSFHGAGRRGFGGRDNAGRTRDNRRHVRDGRLNLHGW
jgi:hypothetical protein